MTDRPLLELSGLHKAFGGIQAVNDVSFTLEQGEVVGLIGPNGAGKTTLVNLITGALPVSSGDIVFKGERVTNQKSHQAARRGIARTFQIVQPFPELTVLQNVAAGALFAGRSRSVADAEEAASKYVGFAGLESEAGNLAANLTLGGRKRLELAKSLAMEPRLLLLDEVNAGLTGAEIDGALDLIRQIARQGITVVIIEHLMKVVFSLSERILVMHQGALISAGPPEEVAEDERVVEAYLGTKFAQRQGGRSAHG